MSKIVTLISVLNPEFSEVGGMTSFLLTTASTFVAIISNRFSLEASSVIIYRSFVTYSLAALLRSSFSLKVGSVIKEQRAARTRPVAMLKGYLMLT